MKCGRKLALFTAVIAGVLCALASGAAASSGGGAWTWSLGAGAIGFALAAAVAIPLGLMFDRDLTRLSREIEAHRDGDAPEPIRQGGELRDLRREAQTTMEALRQRIASLGARLREAEVRRHVTEAEREHAQAILNSLHDAVLVTDAFNELKLANSRAGELFGFTVAEALHKSIDGLITDEGLRRLIHEERDLSSPGHRKHVDWLLSAPAAEASEGEGEAPAQCFDVTLTSLPDIRGGDAGVVTILRDATREREISQMKSDFVSKVSHELRTPLSSINAYVELLVDGEAADEAARQEFYQIIKNEADRLGRLIDNMLNISRIEAGIVKIDRIEVDFSKAARAAVEVIQPQAKLKDISVHVKTTPLACTAMADADMIQQVLLNLLSNAVKYTPEGGRVTLTVDNDDTTGSVLVTVADTGLGIPPDAMPRLFQKFFRIENYKRVAKGTGLGLALVKHIVETVHHGHISVSSELGMGSKFTFTIPYDFEASQQHMSRTAA